MEAAGHAEPDRWYADAAAYWDKVDPTVQGMLGGFGSLTSIDAKSSRAFVAEFIQPASAARPPLRTGLACDCGAGIGRVSETFLLNVFDRVDLVEQNPKFLETAKEAFAAQGMADRVEQYIALGLQDFVPETGRYDLIWCQWVLGHLKDDDLVAFFKRCKLGLRDGGFIGVKENLTGSGVVIDEEDSSCTRSEEILKDLFARAGLVIVKETLQHGFPRELYPVKM
ncbi:alpha-N-methyltransferase NTM1 [Entophlyctis helioformis]|nr:alpha-N-methyltransferase NTM1 [Entophlyctis helioformis]